MGVREIERSLERWELDVKGLQRRMILAPTPREAVCLGTVRPQPEPQQLLELPPFPRGQALLRLGFSYKRPKKRLLKADEARREASLRSMPPLGRRPN